MPTHTALTTLAGQDAGELVGNSLVLPEQESDLAPTHADIARRHVRLRADVPAQFRHEGLTETHDLGVRTALGVKVGSALAAADRESGERVLEHLLKAEELQNPHVDAGVKSQSALERPDRAVELHAEAAIDLHAPGVILPGHAKDNLFAVTDAALHTTGTVGQRAHTAVAVFSPLATSIGVNNAKRGLRCCLSNTSARPLGLQRSSSPL